jgi:hypothetical protein
MLVFIFILKIGIHHFELCTVHPFTICIMNKQNAHLIDSLLYCSIFIAPACFNTYASCSGSSYSLPAKLHKRVHAGLVVFLRNFHFCFSESLKMLKLS